MSELLLKEASLTSETRITIETASGEFTGTYDSRNTSDGYKFWYFSNEGSDYRITLVARDGSLMADVNSTSGDHKTLALMEDVESLVVDGSLI